MTSELCDTVLLVAAFCRNVREYSSAITRTFAIKSVIVVAISHTLSAIYWNSNESSGGTSGCSREIIIKFIIFTRVTPSTKDANMVANGRLPRAHTEKNCDLQLKGVCWIFIWVNLHPFAKNIYFILIGKFLKQNYCKRISTSFVYLVFCRRDISGNSCCSLHMFPLELE